MATENVEMKQILDALEKVEAKMAKVETGNEATLKELGEAQQKLARQLLDIQQKGIGAQKAEVKTAGDSVAESESFKAFGQGLSLKARFEIEEAKADVKSLANPITTPTGGVVQAYRRPGVLAGAFRPLTIESLFPTIPVTTNSVDYVQENEAENTNGAAFVAEGTQKPFGSTAFELKTCNIRTIAHLARVSKQLMADAPALVAYINTRLIYGVDLVVEDQLVTGDGSNQNLTGILHTGSFTDHGAHKADLGGEGCTLFDLMLFAKTKVESAFFRPNCYLMNPSDWSALQMAKNASGDYYLGHPSSNAPKLIWGLPVWTTPAVAKGKFLCGDFNAAATLYTRQGMTVEAFEQDDINVQKNLVTLRAERRLGFGVERAKALVGGAFTVPLS